MSRSLRIEFPGATYHVTSRGDRREAIFEDDVGRQALLEVLAQGAGRFDAQVLAYCLMGNRYHFVLSPAGGSPVRSAGGGGPQCPAVGQRTEQADLSGR